MFGGEKAIALNVCQTKIRLWIDGSNLIKKIKTYKITRTCRVYSWIKLDIRRFIISPTSKDTYQLDTHLVVRKTEMKTRIRKRQSSSSAIDIPRIRTEVVLKWLISYWFKSKWIDDTTAIRIWRGYAKKGWDHRRNRSKIRISTCTNVTTVSTFSKISVRSRSCGATCHSQDCIHISSRRKKKENFLPWLMTRQLIQ